MPNIKLPNNTQVTRGNFNIKLPKAIQVSRNNFNFKVPNAAVVRNRINLELRRAPKNSEQHEALATLKELAKTQPVPMEVVQAVQTAPHPVQYVQEVAAAAPEPPRLVEARREAEQARSSAGASSPVTQQAEERVREIERVVYKKPNFGALFKRKEREPINWNKASLTNNQKLRLKALRNKKVNIPNKVRSGRDLAKFYNEVIRSGKLDAIQRRMRTEFGQVVNTNNARARGSPELKRMLNNVYGVEEEVPVGRAPNVIGQRRAPNVNRAPNVIEQRRVGWLRRFPTRAPNMGGAPNGPGRVARIVNFFKRQRKPSGVFLVPKNTVDPITTNGITNGSVVYRVKTNKGPYTYYGKEGLETWVKEHGTDPVIRAPIQLNKLNLGTAKLVNLKNFGNVPENSKLRERLASIAPFMFEKRLTSKSGKVMNITNMKTFTASMNNNKHYEELMAFLTQSRPVSERLDAFFRRVGLRRGPLKNTVPEHVNERTPLENLAERTSPKNNLTELNKHVIQLAKSTANFNKFKKQVNPMGNYNLFRQSLLSSKLTPTQKELLEKGNIESYLQFRQTLGVPFFKLTNNALKNKKQLADKKLRMRLEAKRTVQELITEIDNQVAILKNEGAIPGIKNIISNISALNHNVNKIPHLKRLLKSLQAANKKPASASNSTNKFIKTLTLKQAQALLNLNKKSTVTQNNLNKFNNHIKKFLVSIKNKQALRSTLEDVIKE
ncbi:hypothetical protein EBX93_11805, partial [bacterium]|nr:hypothetical protein [bacterium]